MIKMNNKGFAVSTILYGILSLTILILMLILGVMRSNKNINASLVESLTNSMNKCVGLEVELENCYISGGSCSNENALYQECVSSNNNVNSDDGGQTPIIPMNGIKLKDKIFEDNPTVLDGENINFFTKKVAEPGLYSVEEESKIYFFRGPVDNNYVKFGIDSVGVELIWRIVRINEDGSIRLIYNGTIGSSTFATLGASENAYVGYMYGTPGSTTYDETHANNNSSTIKGYIDNWYQITLEENYSNYLVDVGFCNDRSIESGLGWGSNNTTYSGLTRVVTNKKPTFLCPNAENDLFTQKGNTNGNRALDYPIGLLTADEAMYAGAFYDTSVAVSHYLDNTLDFWTLTPYWSPNFSNTRMFYVSNTKGLYYDDYGSKGVRPVINLNSNAVITNDLSDGCTEQEGTLNCPYIVNTSK